ncbi:MAG: VWA domain-containing protein [Woeseiaceae bacterium]
MDTLHFLRPLWLLVMPLGLAGLWMLSRYRQRLAGVWANLVDPNLQPYVLEHTVSNRSERWAWWVAGATIVLVSAALSGPAWHKTPVPATRSGDAMIVLFDLSRSMDATDIGPSRLARARLKLQDVLRARQGGETALVVYSANAFVVTPLTEDIDTISMLIPTLTTDLMPSRGSYPESGILKAIQLFEQSGVDAGRILMFTDGGNMPPAISAAREARKVGHELSVLAVGTPEGGPIPQKRGGFVTDSRGNMAIPKMSVSALQRLAKAGGGQFSVLTSDGSDIDALGVESTGAGITDSASSEQSVERWADMGVWFLIPVILLVSLMFRRGSFAYVGVLLLLVVPVPEAHAFGWADLWRNSDQQAADVLAEGDAEQAAVLFDDPAWQAAANYRAGQFDDSADQFSSLPGADGRYNYGNALAKSGDLGGAIAAYKEALVIDPDHEDAAFNLELLEQLKQQQEQEQSGQQEGQEGAENQEGEQQPGQSSDSEQSGDSGSQQPSESQDGQSDEGEDSADAKPTDAEQEALDREALQREFREAQAEPDGSQAETPSPVMTEAERKRAEQQQALEQWLRRVPDDPGGLLRRKFRSQYQRRQLDQNGNRLWPDDRAEPW